MTNDGWIPFVTAVLILGGDRNTAPRRMREALILGSVKSQGIVPRSFFGDREEPEVTVEIPSNLWALWVFREVDQWLVPRQDARRRVCAGYYGVMLSREDVEKLAAEPKREPQPIAATDGERVPPRGSAERFVGRPSLKQPVLEKLRARRAAQENCPTVAAEAAWLLEWVREQYAGDRGLPGGVKTVENIIRA
jgi:hypothetical protein